jgi:hypothetical protein
MRVVGNGNQKEFAANVERTQNHVGKTKLPEDRTARHRQQTDGRNDQLLSTASPKLWHLNGRLLF